MKKKITPVLIVDHTLSFLENHREQAINRLFPTGTQEYKDTWRARKEGL